MAGSVRFAVTVPDLVDGHRLFLRRLTTQPKNLLVYALMLAAITGLAACRWFPRMEWLSDLAPAPIGALIGLLLCQALGYALVPLRIRRSVRQQPGLLDEAVWTWTDTGMDIESPGGMARFRWSQLDRAFVGRRSFILNPQTLLLYTLPRRVLGADEQTDLEATIAKFATTASGA